MRSTTPGSLEEDWFFQALLECYLPLLKVLEKSLKNRNENPKLTISLSPTLLSLLIDEDLKKRFPNWLNIRLELLKDVPKEKKNAAEFLANNILDQLNSWNLCQGDLIKRFSLLQESEVIDILTCAATHGYLPLLRENEECVKAQLSTAVKEHFRLFGIRPQGIWLPECAYYEGLDKLMLQNGIRFSILDSHGILHASPRPRYGVYAPICSTNGVAFFGRDSESTLPVWSSRHGYPGHPNYREFHRDLGWDLPIEILKRKGINEARPLGLKLNKVTGNNISLNKKELYDPIAAENTAKTQALDYLKGRRSQLNKLSQTIEREPLLIAPFDAELFGHWWYEGPIFLSELFKQSNKKGIELIRLKDALKAKVNLQLCTPCPSSWGQGGFHNYWLNDSNSWLISEWSKAGKAMVKNCNNGVDNEYEIRILEQAARELLLLQSSDWSFILRAGTTTELAKERINRHLNRFWFLIKSLENNELINNSELKKLEKDDYIFPLIQADDWRRN